MQRKKKIVRRKHRNRRNVFGARAHHGLVIDVVLEGLLARGEGGGDVLALLVVGGGGELGLQLRLEGPVRTRRHECEQEHVDWEVGWVAHFFASIISSLRASLQLENSAGAIETL